MASSDADRSASGGGDFAPEAFGPDLLLVKKLAAGGMAEVFRARQTGTGGFERTVAVKRILPHFAADEEFKRMFQAEVNLCARFQHPNIVGVYGNGEHAGYLFLVMELVDGKNLSEVSRAIRERGLLMPVEISTFIVSEAAKGLDYAHHFSDEATGQLLGIIHRDISPQNIMLGYGGHVKVVDFGIAKAADRAEMTDAGVIKGKLAYMAPEQAEGQRLDLRTDVFALGIVLHELLTGKRLFKSDQRADTLRRVLECKVDPPSAVNPDVLPELDRIVLRALAARPEERYQSAKELYRDLTIHLHDRFPRFIPTDLADFMQRLFSDAIRAESSDVRDRSADLPTTMTPASGSRSGKRAALESKPSPPRPPSAVTASLIQGPGGTVAAPPPAPPAVERTRTGDATPRAFTAPFRVRQAPVERSALSRIPGWAWAATLVGVLAGVGTVLLLGDRVAPAMPSAVPGLAAWFRADALQLGEGERVGEWPNQADPAASAVQPDEARRPMLRKAMQNGLPAVVFGGQGQYLAADAVAHGFAASSGLTAIYASLISSDRDQYVWSMQMAADRNADVCRAGYSKGDHLRVRTNQEGEGYYLDSERTAAYYGLLIYSIVLDAQQVEVYVNGKKEMTRPLKNPVNFAGAGRFSLGQEWDHEGPSDFLDGAIFELALFNRALVDRERRSVEQYLLRKYAVGR